MDSILKTWSKTGISEIAFFIIIYTTSMCSIVDVKLGTST